MSVVVRYKHEVGESEEVFDADYADQHGCWLAVYKTSSDVRRDDLLVALIDPALVALVRLDNAEVAS